MLIRTPRLRLRDFEPNDWQAAQEYAGDPEAVRYRPFGPCTDKETRDHVYNLAHQIHQVPRKAYDLAIVLAADGRLIGGCDIVVSASEPRDAGIGYGLSRAFWGCGYMTEAVAALIEFGFDELNVERIRAETEPANVASVRVLEKVGMRCIREGQQWIKGELRAVFFYEISAEEWRASPG